MGLRLVSTRAWRACSQPIVQVLASFPANFLFPFATLAFIKLNVSINWGSMLLMALGAQWYILFNVIGGAQACPTTFARWRANLGLRGWQRGAHVIGPGIFSSVGDGRHHGRRAERGMPASSRNWCRGETPP